MPESVTGPAEEPVRGSEHSPAEPRAPRLRVSRRWFLVWFAGGVAALLGGRRLYEQVTATGGTGTPASGGLAGFPVRSVDRVPGTAPEDWVIEVGGLVETPVSLTRSVWANLPQRRETVDFHCVEGWGIDDVVWSGVRVADVLALATPLPAATHAVFHAYDGTYSDSVPLALANGDQSLLADGIDGGPLPPAHGGPVRLVVPSQLGYKSVKWVRRIELADHGVQGYWEQYGYPSDAPVTGAAGARL